MTKREFNKRLNAVGERIEADPTKPCENRLAGPFLLRLEAPAHYASELKEFVKPEEIGRGGFFDTISEARGAVRCVANAIALGPLVDQGIIFALDKIHYVMSKDLEIVERARMYELWN